METKTGMNYVIWVIVIIFLIIVAVSAYKAHQIHVDRQYQVVYQRIKEAAKPCYLEKACEGEITLRELYEKTDLERLYDPVTTENINEDLCIDYIDNKVIFC